MNFKFELNNENVVIEHHEIEYKTKSQLVVPVKNKLSYNSKIAFGIITNLPCNQEILSNQVSYREGDLIMYMKFNGSLLIDGSMAPNGKDLILLPIKGLLGKIEVEG